MQEMKPAPSTAVGISLLLAGGVLAAAGISMLLQRDEFKAAAMVQAYTPPSRAFSQPLFPSTEFEVIQSDPVLSNVIATLNLNERWGQKYNHGNKLDDPKTKAIIKKHLELQTVRNTRFIRIAVYEDDPKDAAELANAISWSYREFRKEESQQRARELDPRMIADPMVTVMDLAIPELKPIRPNRYLARAMLICGLLFVVTGAWSMRGSNFPDKQS